LIRSLLKRRSSRRQRLGDHSLLVMMEATTERQANGHDREGRDNFNGILHFRSPLD